MKLSDENIEINNNTNGGLKKALIIIFVIIIILLISAALIWAYSQKVATEKLQLKVDGISKTIEDGLFDIENGEVYTSINKIASIVGYQEYPGQYKQYVEGDITNCYVTNSKEVATFSSGSSKISKYELLTSDSEAQIFDIGSQVITKGNSLYVNKEGLERAFNLMIQYDSQNNKIEIATLPYLVTAYSKNIPTAALSKDTATGSDDATIFNNQKALLYNIIIVRDSSTGYLGVSKLDNKDILNVTTLNNISSLTISARYTNIEFIEGANNFIVKTQDNKVGILGSDGVAKVKPAYDEIKEIDKENGLYLVVSNNKQGVINQNGKIIIYLDYEQIGLDNNVSDANVTNRYLLYNNCIPVKLNNKWGMFDKSGNKILPLEYDAIGCQNINSSDRNTTGIVLVPDINAVIVGKDIISQSTTIRKYGLVNSTGQLIIQVALENAYKTTIANTTTYYMTYQNKAINIVEFWNKQNIQNNTNTTSTNTTNTTTSDNMIASNTINKNEVSNSISNSTKNTITQ